MYTLRDCDLLSTDLLRKTQWEISADLLGVSNILGNRGCLVADTISSILGLVVSTDPENPRAFGKAFH